MNQEHLLRVYQRVFGKKFDFVTQQTNFKLFFFLLGGVLLR